MKSTTGGGGGVGIMCIISPGRDPNFSHLHILSSLSVVGNSPSGKPMRDGHIRMLKYSKLLMPMELRCIISSRRDFRFSQSDMCSCLRVVGNCPSGKQMRDGHFFIFKYSRRHVATVIATILHHHHPIR